MNAVTRVTWNYRFFKKHSNIIISPVLICSVFSSCIFLDYSVKFSFHSNYSIDTFQEVRKVFPFEIFRFYTCINSTSPIIRLWGISVPYMGTILNTVKFSFLSVSSNISGNILVSKIPIIIHLRRFESCYGKLPENLKLVAINKIKWFNKHWRVNSKYKLFEKGFDLNLRKNKKNMHLKCTVNHVHLYEIDLFFSYLVTWDWKCIKNNIYYVQ